MFKVDEVFYSIQGEGLYSGCSALFIRFYGCNLACPFCDTPQRTFTTMTLEDIIFTCTTVLDGRQPAVFVLTGGEPCLQEELVKLVWTLGCEWPDVGITIETNGTVEPDKVKMPADTGDMLTVSLPELIMGSVMGSEAIDLCISPKWEHLDELSESLLFHASTFKFLIDKPERAADIYSFLQDYSDLKGEPWESQLTNYYVQPVWMDGSAKQTERNTRLVVDFVKADPAFRLSLQLHKYLGIR